MQMKIPMSGIVPSFIRASAGGSWVPVLPDKDFKIPFEANAHAHTQ